MSPLYFTVFLLVSYVSGQSDRVAVDNVNPILETFSQYITSLQQLFQAVTTQIIANDCNSTTSDDTATTPLPQADDATQTQDKIKGHPAARHHFHGKKHHQHEKKHHAINQKTQ